jgi:hypothetical protein
VEPVEVDQRHDLSARVSESEEAERVRDRLDRLKISDRDDPCPKDGAKLEGVVAFVTVEMRSG